MKKKPTISYRDLLAREPAAPAELTVPSEVPSPSAPIEPARVEPEPLATGEMRGAEPAADEARAFLVFRVGRELFALRLDRVEEAVDVESIQRLPEMSETMLGVVAYRDSLVPLYAPSRPLGVALDAAPRAALILALPQGRAALAVDDVDDVLTLRPDALRRSPVELGDGVLVGVARRGSDLIGVLDADALAAACRIASVLETA